MRPDPSRLTTRGWNGYESSEKRAFRYLTPKLRLDGQSLSPPLLASKSFHLICSPTRCIDLVKSILSLRKSVRPRSPLPRPFFIWEPVPDLCVPDQLLETTRALSYIDICSPNHTELGSLMGGTGTLPNGNVDAEFVESATEQLLGSMPLSSYAIVVRAGEAGCYIGKNPGVKSRFYPVLRSKPKSKTQKPLHGHGSLSANTDFSALFSRLEAARQDEDEWVDEDDISDDASSSDSDYIEPDWGTSLWIPAYHEEQHKVVDPTGGGNAFLGSMSLAMARGKSVEEAARWGTVGASFAIEQIGVPVLGKDEYGRETWNDVRVDERLAEFNRRIRVAS
jgi:sugar/nucleoside kinase (ribokinase family)